MKRAAVLAALLLAGCGGAEVPDGYLTYSGQGVSFAHPDLPRKADEDRLVFGDEAAFVELRVKPGEEFETYVRSYVALAEGAGGAKLEIEERDVEKADAARLLKVEGREGLESRVLLVDRGDDVVLLSAGTRSGSRGEVDADAVVDSFRLR